MTRTLNKVTLIILFLHFIIFLIIFVLLFTYPTYKVMWCTSSNHSAFQSSVSGDSALESIFLTTLRAQERAQYGLNSCGLLQEWIETALLNSRLADSRYRKCCFLFIQMQQLCFSSEHRSFSYLSWFHNSAEVTHVNDEDNAVCNKVFWKYCTSVIT